MRWLRNLMPTWQHQWEPLILTGEIEQNGVTVARSTRRTQYCPKCGRTYPFRDFPCKRAALSE